jgi:hypothetical protein
LIVHDFPLPPNIDRGWALSNAPNTAAFAGCSLARKRTSSLQAGLNPISLTLTQPTLDDVFLQVTGQRMQDEQAQPAEAEVADPPQARRRGRRR